jgi:ABC-2 type transport system permease protein
MDAAMAQGIATRYADWAARVARGQQEEAHALLQVRSPAGAEEEALDMRTGIISMIMSGMMVFYVFFTGAASAQSILQEEEAGTLPRLFTTPTPKPAILGGRLIANFVTLVVQVAVLLAVSALIFGIDWGEPLPVLVMALSMIVLAATFGLVVTSFLKSTRQSGIVYGGVLTMAGMIGMLGIFTANVPNASGQTFATVSLLVPQGWAVRGWESLLEGGGVGDVLSTVAVMLGLSLAFFLLGVLKFRKRFA